MPILIDTDEYDDHQLGLTLYRVMALTVENPEPWLMLSEEDKQYYAMSARDFVRQLARMQGNGRRKSKKRLWYFDFQDNRAKSKWFWCPNVAEPTKWIEPYNRNSPTYTLHKDLFLMKSDALRYGLEMLKAYGDSIMSDVARVEEELNTASDDEFLNPEEKQEWIWFDDEPEAEAEDE